MISFELTDEQEVVREAMHDFACDQLREAGIEIEYGETARGRSATAARS